MATHRLSRRNDGEAAARGLARSIRRAPLLVLVAAALSVPTAAGASAGVYARAEAAEPAQQVGTVMGRVVDRATLAPLAAVQVHIPALDIGALTAANGRFLLVSVPAGTREVRAERIGYSSVTQQVEVTAGATAELNFQMSEEALALDEIVVTGTPGAMQKRAIGNVVSRVDASEILEAAPVKDVAAVLNARVPGVVVKSGGGRAGAGSRIRIRGRSSLTLETEPLIYVDGVRVDNAVATGPSVQGGRFSSRLNDLDPDEIESIEIIKGPAAATLYGTEASGGVIQIITKKGRPGTAPAVELRVRQGVAWFQDPEGRFPTNVWRDPATNELIWFNAIANETKRGTPVFRDGHLQGYQLSLSGGSDVLSYYLSTDYDRDEGVELPDVSNRFSSRANLGAQIGKSLDVKASLGLVTVRTSIANDYDPTGSVIGAAMRARPNLRNDKERGFYARPPEVVYATYDLTQDVDRFINSVQINHRPREWLTQRLTIGGEILLERNTALVPRLPAEIAQFYSASFAAGSKSVNERKVTNATVDYSATLSLQLREGLSTRTSAGFQYYRKLHELSSRSGLEFPAPGLETVGAAATTSASDDFIENVTVGTFVQQELALHNRFFLTAALRADDNSAFGKNFTFVTYPKASASWVVSESPFWNVGFVNVLRLRAAVGASGKQPDAFAAWRTYNPTAVTGDRPGVTPGSVGNPDLAPEKGEEWEAGFEAGLFQGRLSIDFTYYHQLTKDALLQADVAPSYGFAGTRWINAGRIRNQGMELLIDGRPIERQSLAWDLTLNLSTNYAKVLDLGGEKEIINDQIAGHRVGDPPFSWYLKRIVQAELDANGRPINVLCDGGVGKAPVPCSQAPLVYRGRTEPVLNGAVTSGLRLFESVRMHGMVDFNVGRRMRAQNAWVRCSSYRVCPENYMPRDYDPIHVAYVELAGSNYELQWPYINSADFAKLRELALTYTIPERWIERFGAKRGSVTFAGRNLHTWSPWASYWSELDPEVSQFSNMVQQHSQAVTPVMASFVTTFNLSF
ncbi:MAG: SusC/RagA family TonB-linked outer membrane protein [Gemmatimonadetes bacterium]|nr:SusC/RagA family TonB-linked outer membrane protein [Gemmatimonadota bacterium]